MAEIEWGPVRKYNVGGPRLKTPPPEWEIRVDCVPPHQVTHLRHGVIVHVEKREKRET